MDTKTCNRCFRAFPADTFPKNSGMPDGRLKQCRECVAAATRTKYLKNKEKYAASQKAYNARNADQIAAKKKLHYEAKKPEYAARCKRYRNNPAIAPKLRACRKAYYAEHKPELLDRQRDYVKSERGREVMAKAHAKERSRHAEKIRARYTLANAIRDGRAKRGSACSKCGSTTKIEAHHHKGYAFQNALDVVWVCMPCHKKLSL